MGYVASIMPIMSDTHHDTPARDGTPPARLLGISENAVRARLRRGTLTGVKHGTAWYVLIRDTDIPPAQTAVHQEATGDAPEHTAVHVDLAPLAELIERQGRELAEMREAAAVWQIRARQAEERLLELSAGETAPETRQDTPGSPRSDDPGLRGVWHRVRRLWGR